MFTTPTEVFDYHRRELDVAHELCAELSPSYDALSTQYIALDAAFKELRAWYDADTQALFNELNNTQNNLALANVELRNLRQWRDATEHLFT